MKRGINLACGTHKLNSNSEWQWINIDNNEIVEPDIVRDITKGLPFEDESIDEIKCYHFIEHLEPDEFIDFFNECWRVLKDKSELRLRAPHREYKWAYIDPTHKRFLDEHSFDFFLYPDYNSQSAGVRGWYDKIDIKRIEGELIAVLRKDGEKRKD